MGWGASKDQSMPNERPQSPVATRSVLHARAAASGTTPLPAAWDRSTDRLAHHPVQKSLAWSRGPSENRVPGCKVKWSGWEQPEFGRIGKLSDCCPMCCQAGRGPPAALKQWRGWLRLGRWLALYGGPLCQERFVSQPEVHRTDDIVLVSRGFWEGRIDNRLRRESRARASGRGGRLT